MLLCVFLAVGTCICVVVAKVVGCASVRVCVCVGVGVGVGGCVGVFVPKKWRVPADQLQEVTTSACTDVLDEAQRTNGY